MTSSLSYHKSAPRSFGWLLRSFVSLGLGTVLLILGGCGELSFKRGGGLDNLEASQHSCHSQYADEADYTKCMAAAGWYTTGLDSTAAPAPGPAMSAPSIAGSAPPPAVPSTGAVPPAAAQPAPEDATASPSMSAPASSSAMVEAQNQFVTVGSWWKFGGGEGDLVASLPQCGGSSDARNRVSRATLLCMKGKGWYGIGTK